MKTESYLLRMKMREFELRMIIQEVLEEKQLEEKKGKAPKHKGKSTPKEKKQASTTLKTQEKGAKTFKGKAEKYYGWADNPEAALGAVYAKAGKNPKKDRRRV